MSRLSQSDCEACRVGASSVSAEEAQGLLLQIPDWVLIEVDGIMQLQRHYNFSNKFSNGSNNFASVMAFANALAALAEQQDHHPSILVEWGKATVTWWTHSIAGLHRNDFVMAAKTDDLFTQQ